MTAETLHDKTVAPTALNWSRSYVSRVAEDIAKQLDYKPGDALEPIVHRLGGQI